MTRSISWLAAMIEKPFCTMKNTQPVFGSNRLGEILEGVMVVVACTLEYVPGRSLARWSATALRCGRAIGELVGCGGTQPSRPTDFHVPTELYVVAA
jgi:hypothetical protein